MAPRIKDEDKQMLYGEGSESHAADDLDAANNDCSSFESSRRVYFSDSVSGYYILNLDEYSEAEITKCWYTRKESKRMQEKHLEIVERMESGKRCKRNASYRGLEDKETQNIRETAIHSIVDAIMDEQEEQWLADIFDWDRFTEISKELSKESCELALKRAKRDEKEAKKLYKELPEGPSDGKSEDGAEDLHSPSQFPNLFSPGVVGGKNKNKVKGLPKNLEMKNGLHS